MAFRPAEHIIAVVVPNKVIRRKLIYLPVMLENSRFIGCVFIIAEPDGLFIIDCVVEHIHNVINALVVGFRLAVHIQIPFQRIALIGTGERRYLFNQFISFLFGNKLCRLYLSHQNHTLPTAC